MPELTKPTRFTVTLRGQTYTCDLAVEATADIDELGGLNTALADTPGKVAWYGVLRAQAEEEANAAKARADLVYAQVFQQVEGTVEAKKTLVTMSKEYQAALGLQRQSQYILALLDVARDVLRNRRDALLEIARNLRAEMDNELTVARRTAQQVLRTPPGRG